MLVANCRDRPGRRAVGLRRRQRHDHGKRYLRQYVVEVRPILRLVGSLTMTSDWTIYVDRVDTRLDSQVSMLDRGAGGVLLGLVRENRNLSLTDADTDSVDLVKLLPRQRMTLS